MYKALIIVTSIVIVGSASANDVFKKNCMACHKDGGNIMNPDKTLSKESLDRNGVNSVAAVKKIIREGKVPMPAFAGKLKDEQIDEVAAYVIEQAGKGW